MALVANSFDLLCTFQKRWLDDTSPLAIGEKSRRIGWTWSHALGAVLGRIQGESNYYHSSADQTASVEFIDYCGQWASMINEVANVTEEKQVIDDSEISSLVMTFDNGRKIVAGSSNPKFFRSKGGEVGLDEFAFHRDGRELYKAAHATAMFWGHPLRMWSTHNGPTSYFNQMIGAVRKGQMKGTVHRVTIEDAVKDGIVERIIMRKKKLDYVPTPDLTARREWLEELRSTCPDQDTWNEEYMCIPSTDGGALLNYELIAACEVANLELWPASAISQWPTMGTLYVGVDVGRKNDRTVIWVIEKIGDVYWTRAIIVLSKATFAQQEDVINQVMANRAVKRCCIDATGLGMDLAERLKRRWGHRVEEVNFTGPVKADLAMPFLRVFQDKLIRVPADAELREDLHGVRKVVTAAGNIRFEADRDGAGHSDRFWAGALAVHAADSRIVPLASPLLNKPLGW
jgi:phage FluMu gp28-like protein